MSCARMVVNTDACIGVGAEGDPLLVCVDGDPPLGVAGGSRSASEAESRFEGEESVPGEPATTVTSSELTTSEPKSALSP